MAWQGMAAKARSAMTHPGSDGAKANPAGFGDLVASSARVFGAHDSGIARRLAMALPGTPIRLTGQRSGHPCPAPDLAHIAAPSAPGLIAQIKACNDALHWRRPGYGALPAHISGQIKVVEIVGPNGMIPHDSLRFGVFWQNAGHFYPQHNHAAEELYHILSGHAEWGQDDQAAVRRSAGAFVHHPPWMRHSIRTSDSPLVAIWGWTGDIASDGYRLSAST